MARPRSADPKLAELLQALIEECIKKFRNDRGAENCLRKITPEKRRPTSNSYHPRNSETWLRVLNVDPNGARSLFSDKRGRISVSWLAPAATQLVKLGFCTEDDCPKPREAKGEGENAEEKGKEVEQEIVEWRSFLELVIDNVRDHRGPLRLRELPLADPDWRIVPDIACVDAVIGSLSEKGLVNICGMSGSGKSILLEQVLEHLKDRGKRVYKFDARPWLEPWLGKHHAPSHGAYAGLCASLIVKLARGAAEDLPNSKSSEAKEAIQNLVSGWRNSEEEPGNKEFINLLIEDQTWAGFRSAVENYGQGVTRMELLARMAAILRFGLRDIVVAIDDVWSFDQAEPVIKPLFSSKDPDAGPAIRLIVTSQEKGSLDLLRKKADFDLDQRDAESRLERAFGIVSAWSVAITGPLDRIDAERAIERFRSIYFEGRDDVRASVQAAIEYLQGHALALAAVAAASRDARDKGRFWRDALKTIRTNPRDILVLEPTAASDTVPSRLTDVLSALRFAWSLLDPAMQERFLDFSIWPSGEDVDEEIFALFWQRAARADELLGRKLAESRRPMVVFAAASLLKSAGIGVYALHDLHRHVIFDILKNSKSRSPASIRHDEFLTAIEKRDASGRLLLYEDAEFTLSDDDRLVFMPILKALDVSDDDLGVPDPFDDEPDVGDARLRAKLGSYLLRHLFYHLREGSDHPQRSHNLQHWGTCFSALQAALDSPEEMATGRSGNMRCLWRHIDQLDDVQKTTIEAVVRGVADVLVTDRSQLAAQLLLRLPSGRDDWLDALRNGAARLDSRPSFQPCSAFAGKDPAELRFRIRGPLSHVCWISDMREGPAILGVRDGAAYVWDARRADVRARIVEPSSRVVGALWIPHADQPGVLTWDDRGYAVISDAGNGRPRFKPLHHPGLEDVRYVHRDGGSPLVLTHGEGRILRIWNAVTGELEGQLPVRDEDGRVASLTLLDLPDGRPGILITSETEIRIRPFESIVPRRPRRSEDFALITSMSLWDLEAQSPLYQPVQRRGKVTHVWRSSYCIPYILSRCSDGRLALIDAITGSLLWEIATVDRIDTEWAQTYGGGEGTVMEFPPLEISRSDRVDGAWIGTCNGRQAIVSITDGSQIAWWELSSGTAMREPVTLRRENGEALRFKGFEWVATAPHGEAIVSWDAEGHVHLHAASGELLGAFCHDSPVRGATFIANALLGPGILSWSDDGKVILWDVTRRSVAIGPLVQLHSPEQAQWVSDARGGPTILSWSGNILHVWDANAANPQAVVEQCGEPVRGIRLCRLPADRVQILSWSREGRSIQVWDAGRNELLFPPLDHDGSVLGAEWITDASGCPLIVSWSEDGTVRIWDGGSGKPYVAPIKHVAPVEARAFKNSKGEWLIAAWMRGDCVVSIFNPDGTQASADILYDPSTSVEEVECVRLPDHRPALFIQGSGGVRLWDLAQQTTILQLSGVCSSDAGWNGSLSDGLIATTSTIGKLCVWDMRTGEKGPTLEHGDDIRSQHQWVTLPDGTKAILSSGTRGVRLWNPLRGEARVFSPEDARYIMGADCINDEHGDAWVMTWASHGEVRVWNAITGEPRFTTLQHDDCVYLAWWVEDMLDGEPAIISFSQDHKIWMWNAVTGEIVKRLDLNFKVTAFDCIQRERPIFVVGCEDGSVGAIEIHRQSSAKLQSGARRKLMV